MSIIESLTQPLGKIHFSSGGTMEAKIDHVLEQKEVDSKKSELLALPPVIRPDHGPGKMMYDYAYNPIQETHPQHDISLKLFNYEGRIPAHEVPKTRNIPGMIETEADGSVTSPIVVELFAHEKAVDVLSRQTPENPGEGYAGKALQIKRLY